MKDTSKIPTVTGKLYCTMIVERKTCFAHIVLHDSKEKGQSFEYSRGYFHF